MYNKILLTTDGSENAERAGEHALWIANASGADIVVLNVFEVYTPSMAVLPLSTLPGSNEDLYEPLKEEGESIAENFRLKLESIKAAQDFKNEIKISTLVKDGKAYHEILGTIEEEDIDLVVMGASGRHGLDRITLGSVTERVVRESKVPVMVIP
jgi:nucleotide-binding universal stress UspA family protein